MANFKGVDSKTLPWARTVEKRLDEAARTLSTLGYAVSTLPDADKTVFSEQDYGQNISIGTLGKVATTLPVKVNYATSTGLYEVTISLAGLVRDGAIFGAGFESAAHPYSVMYDIPKDGVVFSAPVGQTPWSSFASSYSTVVSGRPGVVELSLYLYGNCTAGANSAAYLERARITVKAV